MSNSNTQPQQQSQQPAPPKEEMWLIILAKSKTMRFFSVSCEFILFLGCLWLTMTTILPDTIGWANGSINGFFLVAMGFAVDAAMPEAWLHVVDQWTDNPRKIMHLRWSVGIAIAMSLLVVANVTYSKISGTSAEHPTGPMEAVVNTLLIARILIGISYVAIRECQSFLDRKQAKQQPIMSQAITDLQQIIADLQTQFGQRLVAIATEQKHTFADLQQQFVVLQNQSPALDTQAIAGDVLSTLEPRLASEMKALQSALMHQISVTVTSEIEELVRSDRYKNSAISGRENHSPAITRKFPAVTPGNVHQFPQKASTAEDTSAAIIRVYLEDTSRSQRAIAAMVGTSEATVNRRLKEYLASLQTPPTSTDVTA